MMKVLQILALATTLGIAMFQTASLKAQNKLPIIRSGSKVISIRDGSALSKDTWHLNPQTKPDIYYMQVPRGNRKITFITDNDSISFVPKYGESKDFLIVLNGKDSCLTRITAGYETPIKASSIVNRAGIAADTIPFFMKNSRIYFRGVLNGHPNFNIMFDLGAGMTCINAKSVARSGMKFDGEINIQNTSGTNIEPSSSNNTISLASLTWKKVPVVQVRNLDDGEDMIIGNSLFRDKIVEIDYDKKIVIVSDRLNRDISGYSSHHVNYYQQRPMFEMQIKVGSKYYPFHFLFDTGRDGTMLIGDDFTAQYNLWDRYKSIFAIGKKKIVVIPEVRIGNTLFRDIVTNANNPNHPNGKQSLMGNEILNQFNVILDNHNGMIYLKPNSLKGGSYATYRQLKIQAALLILGVVLLVGLLTFLIIKWKRKRRNRLKNNL